MTVTGEAPGRLFGAGGMLFLFENIPAGGLESFAVYHP